MANEPDGYSAEDRETIHLAKAKLVRVCRCNRDSAERVLQRAAADQRVALISVAMRVLSASPEDLAAGRVVPNERAGEFRQAARPRGKKPPYRPPQANSNRPNHKRPRRGPRKGRR
jgi:hypothetical protein